MGGQVTLENVTTNSITVLVQTPQIRGGREYQLGFTSGFKLAGSKQTMGPLRLELYREWYTQDGNQVYHIIDKGSFSGLVTTEEGKFLRAEIYPESQIVFSPTTYRFELLVENPIPKNGYLQLVLP